MRAGYGDRSLQSPCMADVTVRHQIRPAAAEVTRNRPGFSHFPARKRQMARRPAPLPAAGAGDAPGAARLGGRRGGLVPACRLASASRASRTPLPDPGAFAVAGQRAGRGGIAPPPHADQMAGDAAGGAARPDQFERRKQPPALVAPQDAARDHLPRHRRGIQPMAAEAARDPQPFAQLADLRHAVHGHPDRAAEHVRYRDLAELWKDGGDAALQWRGPKRRGRASQVVSGLAHISRSPSTMRK